MELKLPVLLPNVDVDVALKGEEEAFIEERRTIFWWWVVVRKYGLGLFTEFLMACHWLFLMDG